MLWKTWNDVLSLVLVVLIFALWVGSCFLPQPLPESVIGATIVLVTLVGQYYYRKAKDEANNSA
jgi:hypothetical protein